MSGKELTTVAFILSTHMDCNDCKKCFADLHNYCKSKDGLFDCTARIAQYISEQTNQK